MSKVTEVNAADPEDAFRHFSAFLQFETDCWDVHSAILTDQQDFILLDVRSSDLYQKGHIQGAVNLPHGKIIASKLVSYPKNKLFVTYCAGPHCNGALRGAIRLSRLGFAVKIMPGGITGWLDEGFSLITFT